jgi:hypothetical protein
MVSTLTDTPPEVEEILLEGYRRMSPAERLARALDLGRSVQQLALARILARYGPNHAGRRGRA